MNCCEKKQNKKGFLIGLIYGLVPHIGCIAFIVFAVLGVTAVTALFKPLLLNPYFFYILIALSFIFATISAFFYFKKQGFITMDKKEGVLEFGFLPEGIKRKWKYLLTLYGVTISINLILFMLVFPVLATLDAKEGLSFAAISSVFSGKESNVGLLPFVSMEVAIPCPGHASLITGELKTISGVENIQYKFPNRFVVNYNPEETSKQKILGLDVFRTYKAEIK